MKKYIVAGLLAILAASNAYAEEKKNELSAFLYVNNQITPSGQDPTVTVYASYGRYLKERVVLTVSASMIASGGFTMGGPGVGVKYYFKTGQKGDFVPFLSGEGQFGLGGDANTDIYYYNLAVGGGASYFVTETASLDGRLVYQLGSMTTTTYTGFGSFDSTSSTTAMLLTVGLTQRF